MVVCVCPRLPDAFFSASICHQMSSAIWQDAPTSASTVLPRTYEGNADTYYQKSVRVVQAVHPTPLLYSVAPFFVSARALCVSRVDVLFATLFLPLHTADPPVAAGAAADDQTD